MIMNIISEVLPLKSGVQCFAFHMTATRDQSAETRERDRGPVPGIEAFDVVLEIDSRGELIETQQSWFVFELVRRRSTGNANQECFVVARGIAMESGGHDHGDVRGSL